MQVLDVERGPGPLGSTRFQIDVRFGAEASFELLVYLPAATKAPRVFLGLNFGGNHTVHPDPAIRLPRAWIADWEETQVRDHRATEAGRGTRSRRWPLEMLLARGYGSFAGRYPAWRCTSNLARSHRHEPQRQKEPQKKP
jgi:hypothetical protein